MTSEQTRTVEAVWRVEGARVVATLARLTGDLALAEDLAQEALAEALESWPRSGVPRSPGAWLTTVGRRRAIDLFRHNARLGARYAALARDLDSEVVTESPDGSDDDVLGLMFTACHPVLPRESRVALTLKVVSGLGTEEIARLLLVSVPTVQQRIVRAKRVLGDADVRFDVPSPEEWGSRLETALSVVYLVFTEGYAATSGDSWMRPDLAEEALRLSRMLTVLMPTEPEVHGLHALLELQASRFPARVDAAGEPVLLEDQARTRWDHAQIARGLHALRRSDRLGRGRGPYALQAAIAACHARAAAAADTDWRQIVALYRALAARTGNPVVRLNLAVAVAMAEGPEAGLALTDELAASGVLRDSHLLPSVRGELLARLGRSDEAEAALRAAAALTRNARQRAVLMAKAALAAGAGSSAQ
ncbi:RNA polymerase sigma factor (sigma-70 family) [Nocardioides massiliensis]|uniref:RNA polymerase sigma factor n=2 Tax=Nocardioides massiliensis TaxID=1325935 RepID=A0ABT9NSH6_9ACTN|nr:DUF6596 domain-containing protein [Nocardioides massiliensis]MDP9822990.1 RNA polymerase sigma factor (sigma-70 family) [Nocardioides massiliensis]